MSIVPNLEILPLLTDLLEFLSVFQPLFNGMEHRNEPFDMSNYIIGLTNEGLFFGQTLVSDGNCLIECFLYILRLLDISKSKKRNKNAMEYRSKLVETYKALHRWSNVDDRTKMELRDKINAPYNVLAEWGSKIDGIDTNVAKTEKVYLGEDAISVFCIMNKCHAIRFNADLPPQLSLYEGVPLNFNFFYNRHNCSDNTRIACIVMMDNHFVPLTIQSRIPSRIIWSHPIIFSTLFELIARYQHNVTPIPNEPYISEPNGVLKHVLNFRCPLTIFETELRKQFNLEPNVKPRQPRIMLAPNTSGNRALALSLEGKSTRELNNALAAEKAANFANALAAEKAANDANALAAEKAANFANALAAEKTANDANALAANDANALAAEKAANLANALAAEKVATASNAKNKETRNKMVNRNAKYARSKQNRPINKIIPNHSMFKNTSPNQTSGSRLKNRVSHKPKPKPKPGSRLRNTSNSKWKLKNTQKTGVEL